MTLREQRVLFCALKQQLLGWCSEQDIPIAEDEGKVFLERKSRAGTKFQDGVHMRGSRHYDGCAQDLIVYLDLDGDGERDDYVADGNHEIWRRIGERWEGLHPLCRWGGRFGDSNHISLVSSDGRK